MKDQGGLGIEDRLGHTGLLEPKDVDRAFIVSGDHFECLRGRDRRPRHVGRVDPDHAEGAVGAQACGELVERQLQPGDSFALRGEDLFCNQHHNLDREEETNNNKAISNNNSNNSEDGDDKSEEGKSGVVIFL